MDLGGWASIPPEIFCIILEYCSAKRAIKLELVCKRWSEYFSEETWQKFLSPSQLAYCSLEHQQWGHYLKAFERSRKNMKEERCVVYEIPSPVSGAFQIRFSLGGNNALVGSTAMSVESRHLIDLSSHTSQPEAMKLAVTKGYQILHSSARDMVMSVLEEKTGAVFNIDIPYEMDTIVTTNELFYIPNNDVNYPSIIRIDRGHRVVCVFNLKERAVKIARVVWRNDKDFQLHGKYFVYPTHLPDRIEVVDIETNLTVTSLPRYENQAVSALGDNRILYATQVLGGGVGWRLVDFNDNVVNEDHWPSDIEDLSNKPCLFASVLANDMIAIGCPGRIHFIDARKKKNLCTLGIPLDEKSFNRVDGYTPSFTCVSPGRFVVYDGTICLKVIDFESNHILAKRSVVVLNADGTHESVKTSASELMKLAKENTKRPQIRVFRIWETSTVRLSMITSGAETLSTVNNLATKMFERRKSSARIPGIDAHHFGSESGDSIEDFTTLGSPSTSKVTDNAIIIKEELINGEWRLVDYEFTAKHFHA